MTGRAVLVLVVSAGCTGDPSVSIRFEVPDGYQDLVDTVALEVLVPPDDQLDCDAIALGNASEEDQTGARVAQALVREPGDPAPLDGIPRTGQKLFVARALGATSQLVAAGCASAGTIDGDLEVVITGEPALTIGARDTTDSGELPAEVTLLLSDARGEPVAGAAVEHTVFAAAGSEVSGDSETSGKGGVVRLTVPQPTWAGPQVLDVDLRWQSNQRDLIFGFKVPPPRADPVAIAGDPEETLPTRVLYQVGRIGPAGEMGVAALGRDNGSSARVVHVCLYDPTPPGFTCSQSPALPIAALGLIEGSDRDEVVAMSAGTWYRIQPGGQVMSDSMSGPVAATALFPTGDCTPGALRDQLLALGPTGKVALYDASGSRIADWQGGQPERVEQVLAAGCVRGLDATYRAAVYQLSSDVSPRPVLVLDARGTEPAPINTLALRGIAFTPLTDSSEGPYLVANRFENDGNSIARYSVVPVDQAPTFLDQVTEDETAGLADTTAAGDFDGDGLIDVAALVAVPVVTGGSELRFFMSLGTEVEGQRLFGLAGSDGRVDRTPNPPLIIARDFDGDAIDDLLVATPMGFSLFELEPE